MTIAKVQSVNGNTATQTLNSVVSGNCLTYQDAYFRGVSTGVAETTPTDSNGTMAVGRADAPQVQSSQDQGVGIFYEKNCAAGTHTVTPQNNGHNGTLTEWSGLDTANPLDVTNSAKNVGTGTSQATGTTGTTAQADELALISFGMAANTTGVADVGFTDPVSGYTTLSKITNDAADIATMHCYQILTSVATQSATFNWTNSELDQFWQAAIVTLLGAGPGIGPANITSSAGRFIGWTR